MRGVVVAITVFVTAASDIPVYETTASVRPVFT